MKVALIQLNYTVGDLEGNAARIIGAVRRAHELGADLAVTSELALVGYPPRDLLFSRRFVERSWETLRHMAEALKDAPPTLVGLPEPNGNTEGRPLFNAAALLRDGAIHATFRKTLLPTYDVFDEDRYFEPASAPQIFTFGEQTFGVTICEDVWNDRDFWQRRRYHVDPVEQAVNTGLDCIINLSASPFTAGKQQLREAMLGGMAARYQRPLIYVNQCGGNDDLVFDGRSCAFDAQGRLIARACAFDEDVIVVHVGEGSRDSIAPDDFTPESEIWGALVLGTRDYVAKCGFKRVLLGLSGGVDSCLTAAIAAEAVGSANVLGVLMPSPYSSAGSVDDSRQLAANLNIETLTLPIAPIMQAYDETLQPTFAGYPRGVTEENIQARIRGNLLMSLSNKYGALLLTTGNKSELAVGYCTLYGDMSGGLAVISDVPKTMVYRLARWLNARSGTPVIPVAVLAKAPSAELRPNQTDQDSLPPYEVLDPILAGHIEQHLSAEEIVSQGFEPATVQQVLRLVTNAEFKRKQAAPGLKVTDRAFGTGWRVPIARR